ncbi:DUF3159 domain-containing protein [Gleimia sp. 6138-11-ORH1]|uniref:DUF3159 domain-containing protein n=1 Tax=Gleimia sp. 6138-11-ORH1 TaxID=2973937 RepID=UPI0021689880|nr:DUF3159 domain-containing protein [Gleimia sp. 6138-11-ORH1]MCS4484431.1 DUF3159 domain-containing protein [Gleimia sp. 6138-11-ORH1]
METETTKHNLEASLDQSALVNQLNTENFDMWQTVGGVRGLLESTLPGLVFVVLFAIYTNLQIPLLGAGIIALGFAGFRLVTKGSLSYALSGIFGVGIGVLWAWLSGRGENFFSLGLITGSIYGAVIITANLIGYPVAAMLLSPAWGLPWKWWKNRQVISEKRLAPLVKASLIVSWLWAGLFILRVGLQLPFWLSGNVAVLGILKLILGIPPFVLCVWLSWLLLHPLRPQD